MSDLSACTYSSEVFTTSEQNSEALVFLVGKERLNQLKKLSVLQIKELMNISDNLSQ